MTMFSAKPPFDLAAFLAVPAKVGTAGRRNARRAPTPPAAQPAAEPAGDAPQADDTPET